MTTPSPRSAPTLVNQFEIGPDLSNKLLTSFRSVFTDPDLVSKIQEKIDALPNGIHKMLMNAALRRILHHISSALKIQEELELLMKALGNRPNSPTQQA